MEKPAQKRNNILAIKLCIFCLVCSLSIPGSSIASLSNDMGGSASSLGTARTIAQLGNLALGLGISPIMNTIGTKKALITVCAISGTGILVCTVSSSVLMLYAGIILGAIRSHAATVGKTMVAHLCDTDELPKEFGAIGMTSGLAFVAGPILSIILSKTIGCVWIAGCLSALLSFGIAMTTQGTSSSSDSDETTQETSSDASISVVAVLPYVLVSIGCTTPFSALLLGVDSYLVSRFRMEPGGIAGLTAVVAVSFAVGQGALFAKVHRRLGSVPLLLCSGVAVAAPLLVIDYLESIPIFTMLLVGSVLAMSCCQGSVDVMMVELTTPNKSRGTALASTVSGINAVVMPVASGLILDAGLPLFRIAASVCAAGVALGFLVLPRKAKHDKPE